MSEISNAKITQTQLHIEDHGFLTFWLHLTYGGSGQSFGGYIFANAEGEGNGFMPEVVFQILKIAGVSKWEDLPGKHIRAEHDWNKVHRIGHILKDEWLNIQEVANKHKTERTH